MLFFVAWVGDITKDVSSINRTYRHKIEAVAKAKANRDWGLFVSLHEKPYRLDALLRAAENGLRKNPLEFWALVGRVWKDSENVHQHPIRWRRVWAETIEGRWACMSDEDPRIFDSLPEKIVVWRGTSHQRGLAGLSWTRDREMAVFFARRRCSEKRVPLLAKGLVEKGDILAYFGGRGEGEIVSMKVSIMSVTKLSDIPSDDRSPIVTTSPTIKPVAPMPTLNLI